MNRHWGELIIKGNMDSVCTLEHQNGVHLGELVREVDGRFTWYPEPRGGCYASHILLTISDILKYLEGRIEEI